MSGRTISREDARAAIIGAQFPAGSDLTATVARTGFIRVGGDSDQRRGESIAENFGDSYQVTSGHRCYATKYRM